MAIADVAEYAHLSDADEHHLYPDLPSNRYAEIAQQVRAVCATYDLPRHDRSVSSLVPALVAHGVQAGAPRSVPVRHLRRRTGTASEDKFRNVEKRSDLSARGDDNARRRGLGTALLDRKNRRAAS
jgi:hypothetical protein